MPRQPRVARDDDKTGMQLPGAGAAPAQNDDRTSREQEARANDTIHEVWDDVDWKNPSLLDAPPPRPGMVQRWVTTAVRGEDDPANVAKRLNQGWRPRKLDTVPKDFAVPTISHGQFAGYIGVVGMVLMERPAGLNDKAKSEVRERTSQQMAGVNAALSQVHNPGDPFSAPRLSNKTAVERGRVPVVADDD